MSAGSPVKGNRFVIIGRAGMDLYPDPPGTRTETATRFFACLGGSAANIAAAIVRLGGKAALVTCVSDDAIGRFVTNQLDEYEIDRSHVRPVGGEARNSLALVETRVEDHQSVIYRNGAADFQMGLEDVAGVDYTAFDALITTGTVFAGEPSRTAALHAIGLARSAGLPVIFDVDYRPYSWSSARHASKTYSQIAALCDIIIGNDKEFGFMAGRHDKGLDKARALASNSAAIVVYKMGPLGAITFTPDNQFKTGIYAVNALKPTGAGDAFLGGFVTALAGGKPLQDAVLQGSACAAIVVARVGCAPAMPTVLELERFVASQPRPAST